jgi:hypothetical protein
MPHYADQLLTLAIVATASGYLAFRAWGVFKKKRQGGCGSCASCPSESAAAKREPQVFGLDQLLEPLAKKAR